MFAFNVVSERGRFNGMSEAAVFLKQAKEELKSLETYT